MLMYVTNHSKTLNTIRSLKSVVSVRKCAVIGKEGVGKSIFISNLQLLPQFKKTEFEEFHEQPEDLDRFEIVINLPGFEESPEDIAMISRDILGTRISDELQKQLTTWHWPGEREELVTFLKAISAVTPLADIPESVFYACKDLRPVILSVLPLSKDICDLSKKFGFEDTIEALSRVALIRSMVYSSGKMKTAAEVISFPYHKFHYEIQKAPKIWKTLCKKWHQLEKNLTVLN